MAKIFVYFLHFLLIFKSNFSMVQLDDSSEGALRNIDILGTTDSHVPTRKSADRDMLSINMFKVYEKYSKEPHRQRDGNTVRGFRGVPGISNSNACFQFNLSSFQASEKILSASFHFLDQRPRHHPRPWLCRRSRNSSCRLQHPSPSLLLRFQGKSAASAVASFLGNVTLAPHHRGSWQARDITWLLQQARDLNQPLVTVEFDFGLARSQHPSPWSQPYILVYADDQAIDEPNSMAMSLQRYGPSPAREAPAGAPNAPPPPSASRIRRASPLSPMEQIQTNNLPGVHLSALKSHELWQSTYFPPRAKAAVKEGRKQGPGSGEGLGKPQVLSFDERIMNKARRKQWSEPRVCSRRYLRVDFADIGWSEWVLAPKAFDAYYCAGTCGFPIPKVVRPSNHATIQSIVRAVGIIPGVPEPCCVPDKMSPLSVLFLDPSRNMVLKVYPGMSVDTCSCR
ncbi:growth/differentiation factor 10 [Aplochiton taeniatus]